MLTSRQSTLALILLLGLGAWLFIDRAMENGRLANIDSTRTDQGAYLKYAENIRKTDFTYVGGRNRMPAYPTLLAAFMEKEPAPGAFFEKGKQINLWLTFGGLVFLGGVFLRSFPRHHALNVLFLTAFCVFAFKAAYVQAEILYYLLSFAVFLICWHLFRKPSLILAVLAGGILGLAHLTKASVLPGLLVFAVFYPLDTLWQSLRRKPPIPLQPWKRIAVTALLAITFFATISPYIARSKAIYGQYFYNVNSTFYIWCESWKDVEKRTKAAGDRDGWPDLPPDEIPSLKNYLRTHSAGDITWRVISGCSRVFNSMKGSYGYLGFCVAYLVLAFWVAWKKRFLLRRVLLHRPVPFLALAAYFVGYYLLIAWYSQIISGNRFVLGLFLPFLFTISVFLVAFSRRINLKLPGGFKTPLFPAFNTLVSVWLFVEIVYNCLVRLPTLYSGN